MGKVRFFSKVAPLIMIIFPTRSFRKRTAALPNMELNCQNLSLVLRKTSYNPILISGSVKNLKLRMAASTVMLY